MIKKKREGKKIVQKPSYCNISQKRHSHSLRKNSSKKKKKIQNFERTFSQDAQGFQALKCECTLLSDTRSIMPAQLGNERACARRQRTTTTWTNFNDPHSLFLLHSFNSSITLTTRLHPVEYVRQIRDTEKQRERERNIVKIIILEFGPAPNYHYSIMRGRLVRYSPMIQATIHR